jgi:hypothetical protein
VLGHAAILAPTARRGDHHDDDRELHRAPMV